MVLFWLDATVGATCRPPGASRKVIMLMILGLGGRHGPQIQLFKEISNFRKSKFLKTMEQAGDRYLSTNMKWMFESLKL